MDALQTRLRQMQVNMKKQMEDYKPGGGGGEPLPTGLYTVKVRPVMTEARSSKKIMISWTFVVSDGELTGRKVFDNTVLEGNEGPGSVNKVGSQICRNRIEDLGETWPENNLLQLQQVIDKINKAEPEILVDVRQNAADDQGRINHKIYFRANAAAPESPSAPEEVPSGVDASASTNPMLDICTRLGVNGITDDMTETDIVDSLRSSTITFKRSELTDGEVDTLNTFDAADLIEEDVPADPEPPRAPLSRQKAAPAAPARRAPPAKAKVGKGKK
jgi:hypothetical protein